MTAGSCSAGALLIWAATGRLCTRMALCRAVLPPLLKPGWATAASVVHTTETQVVRTWSFDFRGESKTPTDEGQAFFPPGSPETSGTKQAWTSFHPCVRCLFVNLLFVCAPLNSWLRKYAALISEVQPDSEKKAFIRSYQGWALFFHFRVSGKACLLPYAVVWGW